jgi:hypothetical protein
MDTEAFNDDRSAALEVRIHRSSTLARSRDAGPLQSPKAMGRAES